MVAGTDPAVEDQVWAFHCLVVSLVGCCWAKHSITITEASVAETSVVAILGAFKAEDLSPPDSLCTRLSQLDSFFGSHYDYVAYALYRMCFYPVTQAAIQALEPDFI